MDKISEKNKQEAEKVVEMYVINILEQTPYFFVKSNAVKCAIQDRQSVLEELIFIKETFENYNSKRIEQHFYERIQSLTEQIEFLKSKL